MKNDNYIKRYNVQIIYLNIKVCLKNDMYYIVTLPKE